MRRLLMMPLRGRDFLCFSSLCVEVTGESGELSDSVIEEAIGLDVLCREGSVPSWWMSGGAIFEMTFLTGDEPAIVDDDGDGDVVEQVVNCGKLR